MTSEILQLFTQALEMLISWSSFDCILDSRMCNFISRTITIKSTSHNIALSVHSVGSEWFCPVYSNASFKKAFYPLVAGWNWGFFDEMHTTVLFPWLLARCRLWCGGSMVFHKGDGRQLLTELFQHNHTLQQRDVLDTGKGKQATSQSMQGISRSPSLGKSFR